MVREGEREKGRESKEGRKGQLSAAFCLISTNIDNMTRLKNCVGVGLGVGLGFYYDDILISLVQSVKMYL